MKRKDVKQLYELLKKINLKDAPDSIMIPMYKNLAILKPLDNEIEQQNQLIGEQNLDDTYYVSQRQYVEAIKRVKEAKEKGDVRALNTAEELLRLESEIFKPLDMNVAQNIQRQQRKAFDVEIDVKLYVIVRKTLTDYLQKSGYNLTGEAVAALLPIIKE